MLDKIIKIFKEEFTTAYTVEVEFDTDVSKNYPYKNPYYNYYSVYIEAEEPIFLLKINNALKKIKEVDEESVFIEGCRNSFFLYFKLLV